METTYQIASIEDFDRFLAELAVNLIAAAPAAWPVTKIALDAIAGNMRATLSLTLKRAGETFYLTDATDRIVWEQEDRLMSGRIRLLQVPKY